MSCCRCAGICPRLKEACGDTVSACWGDHPAAECDLWLDRLRDGLADRAQLARDGMQKLRAERPVNKSAPYSRVVRGKTAKSRIITKRDFCDGGREAQNR